MDAYDGEKMEKTTTYKPGHVANFIIEHAWAEDRTLSQMELQKLTYISYGWVLAVLDKKLFDEPFYAWKHGPVCESLYHEFKHFGKTPITHLSYDYDLDDEGKTAPKISSRDVDTTLILRKVWGVYKRFDPWDLVKKTHEEGTPWHQVYQKDKKDIIISDDLIKPHFKTKITEYLSDIK